MPAPRHWLPTLLLGTFSFSSAAPVTPPPTDGTLLGGLRAYRQAFTPVPGETSLLAHATANTLDWTAFQNLFSQQVTDTRAGTLDWRGHSTTPTGSVFTTLRAATYPAGTRTLLVVNREWCAAGTCQTRTAFGWFDGGRLNTVNDTTVIPLIRDADFYTGAVPACLRGVALTVTYVPARAGSTTLSALAVAPRAAQQACAQAGVAPEAVTRPLKLNWTPSVGKFRRGW